MTNEEQLPGEQPGDGVPSSGEGSEAGASGPQPQNEELTVEDILSAEQSAKAAGAEDAASPDGSAADDGSEPADPHLEDLRRLSAEYANYRKRTEANAVIEKQRATAAAILPLLAILDDLDRAEQHGDLEEGGAFATIAQKLRGALERMGLESYGAKDDPFDPQLHEAIAQVPVPGTEQPIVLDVIERGYRLGDVELRPAKVAVAVGADG